MSNTLKFMFVNLSQDMMLEFVDLYSELLSKADSENIKFIHMFLLRIFNKSIAFKLELRNTLKLTAAYKANLKQLMSACLSMNLVMMNNFWSLHGIVIQKYELANNQ